MCKLVVCISLVDEEVALKYFDSFRKRFRMYLHVKLSTVLKQFCEIINKGNRVMYVSEKLIELPIKLDQK